MPATTLDPITAPTSDDVATVVRDRAGRVVLVCWGADAADEGRTWADRGYRVDAVGLEWTRA